MDKNKNLLILGAGQYGEIAKETAESMGCFEKISFLDDSYKGDNKENNLIVGKLCDYKNFAKEYAYAIVAIGNSELRLKYIEEIKNAQFKVATLISPRAYVSSSAIVMYGSIVEAMSVINANASIAVGVYVCAGAIVNHNSIVEDGSTLQCGSVVSANSRVLTRTILGYNEVFVKNKS